jgi:hypothetical protein
VSGSELASVETGLVRKAQHPPEAIAWRPRVAAVPEPAQRSVGAGASAEQAESQPPGEPEAAVVLPLAALHAVPGLPQAGGHAEVAPQQEAEAWVGAAVAQQAAEVSVGEAVVPQPEVVVERVWAGVPQPEVVAALGAVGVVRRRAEAAPVWRGRQRAVLPSAEPWVFHQGQLRRLARLVPLPAARLAHAIERRRIALP